MTNAPRPAGPGDRLHVLASGAVVFGNVWSRGDVITLTPELCSGTVDLNGNSWLDDLSEPAQIRRWGSAKFGLGPAPADLEPWIHGSPEWAEAREAARRAAWAETSDERRRAALKEVEARYGPPPVTSTETNRAPNPSAAQAEEQRARLAAAGVRQLSNYSPSRREV